MPRYHFNLSDGRDLPDLVGTELSGIAEARLEAIRLTGAVLNESPEDFWDAGSWEMVVTDEGGLILFSLHLLSVDAAAAQPRRSGSG